MLVLVRIGHYLHFISLSIDDTAEFDVTLKRFNSNTYVSQDTSGTVRLGDPLFFKLKLSTDRTDLKMQPQNCYATATPGSAARHYLIKDRCTDAGDGTVQLPSTAAQVMSSSYFSWSNQAFRFFGSSANIYIVCDVLICLKTDTSPPCGRCGGARKRRDVFALDTDEGRKMSKKVTAPLIVILDDNQSSGQSTGNSNVFSGTQGTIILVLLIALALVALALIVKKLVAPVRSNAPVAMTNVETGFENKGMDKI